MYVGGLIGSQHEVMTGKVKGRYRDFMVAGVAHVVAQLPCVHSQLSLLCLEESGGHLKRRIKTLITRTSHRWESSVLKTPVQNNYHNFSPNIF